jgi:PilZ domain
MKSVNRWLESLSSRERRRAPRREVPNLVAHYWDGAAPLAHHIRDISTTGLYLLTEQRWYPGTLVRILLQRTGVAETDPDRSITVNAKVVRSGSDGVGLTLVLLESHAPQGTQRVSVDGADRQSFHRFWQLLLVMESEGEHLSGQQRKKADSRLLRVSESEQG